MPLDIAKELEDFVRVHGAWTAHNIHLGGGVHTMGERPVEEIQGLKRIVQTAVDLAGRPIDQLRVLDLGCGEGLCGIEFARHGARVVCVDGREANLEKGRFVQRVLGLTNLEFRQDDIRNLSEQAYGRFDVVLCIGVLYHINDPDMLDVLRRIHDVCDRVAIIHTHVSSAPRESFAWNGRHYRGRRFLEHLPGENKDEALWASLQNDYSFWLTRPSLMNALMDVGFTSVLESRLPFMEWQQTDHGTFAAVRGIPVPIRSMTAINEVPPARLPERAVVKIHPSQTWFYPTYRRISARLPRGTKDVLKRTVHRMGGLGMWWSTPKKGHRD